MPGTVTETFEGQILYRDGVGVSNASVRILEGTDSDFTDKKGKFFLKEQDLPSAVSLQIVLAETFSTVVSLRNLQTGAQYEVSMVFEVNKSSLIGNNFDQDSKERPVITIKRYSVSKL